MWPYDPCLQEELEPFLGCIGGAANSSSAALAPAPHVEPSARSPPKHGLSGIAFACRIAMVVHDTDVMNYWWRLICVRSQKCT